MNRSARRSTSLSPPDDAGDPPLDAASGEDAAALLARDRLLVVAVPRLADLDVLELDDEDEEAAGDTTLPSTSSSPGARGPKLRPRRGRGAARASSIHRVAPEESRNRTFLTASRRAPRIDARLLLLDAAASSSADAGLAPETAMDDPTSRARGRVGVVTGNAYRAVALVCVDVGSKQPLSCTTLVRWLAALSWSVYIGSSSCGRRNFGGLKVAGGRCRKLFGVQERNCRGGNGF